MTNPSRSTARARLTRALLGLFLLGAILSPRRLPAASLTGNVLEDGNGKPLAGVTVSVTTVTGTKLPSVITDGAGKFSVPDVPAGLVKIRYSTGGYLKNPTEKSCQVSDPQSQAADVFLFKKSYSPDYLLEVANRQVLLANGDAAVANKRWEWYENLPIPVSAKAELAQAIAQKDQRLANASCFVAYRGIDVEQVAIFERSLAAIDYTPTTKLVVNKQLPAKTIDRVMKSTKELMPAKDWNSIERAVAIERNKVAH